ncbi:MAG: hypothetical protein DMF61_24805 [Blastocatellia bacterium AA13]|nr:MAG: hypothetical protein DMF61_24805 [Blastocatellia bacterium AA13]
MAASFGENAKPLVSPYVAFEESNGDVDVVTPDATFSYSGFGARIMSGLKESLDGNNRVSELATRIGVSGSKINEAIAVLAEDAYLIDLAALEETQSSEFFDAYFEACKFWAKEIFLQPFWDVLLSGKASRSLILGWGIEFFHYANSANEHMPASVAYCRTDKATRRLLSHHYLEEHDHGEMFLAGLEACGISRSSVIEAPPIASTRALIHFLSELAVGEPAAYMSAFGIMQAPTANRPKGSFNNFYDRLERLYPSEKGLFDALKKHAATDDELGHEITLLKRFIAKEETINPERRQKILDAARATVEYFVLYFEGILDYYSTPGVMVPRRALDIRTVLQDA